ncbi:MAG: phosphoribosylformylglycinamidine synthase subunit PurQ, partial [Ruminiclostridium sp.]|nr:phosphoribosylformylglycinamidine synthase subunit PurQ [Ruminiclostridium sp.]
GAIGGKDSMCGTFEHIDVPPTLVSFAGCTARADKIISAEFKLPYDKLYYIAPSYDKDALPDFESVKAVFGKVEKLIAEGKAVSVWSLAHGGVAEGIFKMSLGNRIGAKLNITDDDKLFGLHYGAFIIESGEELGEDFELIGETTEEYRIVCGDTILDCAALEKKWDAVLEPIFRDSVKHYDTPEKIETVSGAKFACAPANRIAKPRVLIPAFPGTNGEYDMAEAFRREGCEPEIFVVRNLSASAVEDSVNAFADLISRSNIIAVPGGFSGGDEPEGSGKFINAFFRNPRVKEAVNEMLYKRDGLILGICNGFQSLIKLGLVPVGDIVPLDSESPTLTFNKIGRHQSQLVRTRICTDKSPWLADCKPGDIFTVPISHGEGRFVASDEVIKKLIANGQVATQYVDLNGDPTMDLRYNPNSSMYAVEGIISPDGRVLGKMGHSERISADCCTNVDGIKEQPLFRSGIRYFS